MDFQSFGLLTSGHRLAELGETFASGRGGAPGAAEAIGGRGQGGDAAPAAREGPGDQEAPGAAAKTPTRNDRNETHPDIRNSGSAGNMASDFLEKLQDNQGPHYLRRSRW